MSVRTWLEEPRGREMAGIAGVGMTALLFVALLTYSPHDPSFFASSAEGPRNWIGPLGAEVSAWLFEGLGFAAWLVPFVLAAAALRRLAPREGLPAWRRSAALGLLLVLVATALFLSLLLGRIDFRGGSLLAGGLGGRLVADGVSALVGEIGALLVGLTLLAAGVALSARSPLGVAAERVFVAGSRRAPRLARRLADASGAAARVGRTALALGGRLVPRGLIERIAERRRARTELAEMAPPTMVDDEESSLALEEVDELEPAPSDQPAPSEAPGAKRKSRRRGRRKSEAQPTLPIEMPKQAARLPPFELLERAESPEPVSRKELLAISRLIERRCAEFNVEGQVLNFHPGPVVTTFEFRPNAGIKLSRITALADDLALALEAENVRIDRLPGRPTVGIEVPNKRREIISLREVVESPVFRENHDLLNLGLGKDQSGEVFCAPLSRMPHLLIAGATGAGKSVGLNTIITSILFRARPEQVRFILVDPKMLELGLYDGLPHLLVPVVTDMKLASNAFKWAVREMERRYRLLAACGVRHLDKFNKLVADKPEAIAAGIEKLPDRSNEKYALEHLPYIVIVVDELADMLMTTGPDVIESIARLAQKARAVGIHLVLATQRPSVDVLVGAIKANFPARMAFKVSSKIDSRTILDASGAERLLGSGDMLYRLPASSRLVRVHGAWISEEECQRVVGWIKSRSETSYDESVLAEQPGEGDGGEGGEAGGEDPLYWDAVRVVVGAGQGSTSFLQRRMKLGYSRAARIVDQLEENGVLGPADGSKPRKCLVGPEFLDRVDQIRDEGYDE